MRVAIDSSGRLVVPKPLREALGFRPGQELDATIRDGQLEIAPLPATVQLEMIDGRLVAVPEETMPRLDAEIVRDTLENLRR